MDHQKIYDNIILNAKFQNRIKHREIYYEEHHIVPKCLGGEEEKENKVLLTAREHFVNVSAISNNFGFVAIFSIILLVNLILYK